MGSVYTPPTRQLTADEYRAKLTWYGHYFGYPECCIEQFVDDAVAGRYPGEMRGLDASGTYVPCDACKARQ